MACFFRYFTDEDQELQRPGKLAKFSVLEGMVLGYELEQLGSKVSALDHYPRLGEATGTEWVVIKC